MKKRATQLVRYTVGLAALRASDVWLASFPKSGSTWVRFFFCNYANLAQGIEEDVDFHRLDDTMVALGYSDLRAPWTHSSIPRIIKTHHPYRRVLFRVPQRAIYLQRDPRDVMVSYYHFLRNHTRVQYSDSFAEFIRHPRFGLGSYLVHWKSWSGRRPITVRYEALRSDPVGTFTTLLDELEIEPVEHWVRGAVERSTISRVRSLQQTTGLSGEDRFRRGFNFARNGSSGQWPDYFDPPDIEFYGQLCEHFGFQEYTSGSEV